MARQQTTPQPRMFQHTAARRRLGRKGSCSDFRLPVSTHSRPKAAGIRLGYSCLFSLCFNTQPPEGGWGCRHAWLRLYWLFQHTAARRRLAHAEVAAERRILFQHTAARRRLGLSQYIACASQLFVSTHSRPKAAGLSGRQSVLHRQVSTHSRPKAAGKVFAGWRGSSLFQHTAARRRLGQRINKRLTRKKVSTHSRPKAAGSLIACMRVAFWAFQHTAARRRLVLATLHKQTMHKVSTHSRPKAAGFSSRSIRLRLFVSTHSRPKAAGRRYAVCARWRWSFNTQPPEGGWGQRRVYRGLPNGSFNTQPPEGGWK